jgi:hypothetical protein
MWLLPHLIGCVWVALMLVGFGPAFAKLWPLPRTLALQVLATIVMVSVVTATGNSAQMLIEHMWGVTFSDSWVVGGTFGAGMSYWFLGEARRARSDHH